MWLTRLSIFRPVTITMLVVAVLVLGFVSWSLIPTDLYPDIEFPWVTVVSIYPGTGPEEAETLITKPIEDAVSTISGVKNVVSTSQEGVSTVSIEFYLGTNLDTAANDVREKVDAARFLLPSDMDPPVIEKFSISAMPVLAFALSSPRPPDELRLIADDIIKDRMGKLKGVGAVRVAGGDIREILVAVDKGRLEAYGLTINDVTLALRAANLNLPSGTVEEGLREYAVRAVGEFQSPDELSDVQLHAARGRVISLRDIADISDTVAERRQLTRVDGKDSVAVTVLKQSGANTVEVADAVRTAAMRLTGQTFDERGDEVLGVPEPEGLLQAIKYRLKPPKPVLRKPGFLPSDIDITITMDQSIFIRESLEDLRSHLVLGALLAVLVVFLFLHNFRGTIIVALAIPTSLVATFGPMHFAGFTLNMMTMMALALSVGILVDDSIVVIENIYRHLRMGEEPKEAAFNGRTEIGLAAISITLVDVVVFVPIAFMGGIVGQFFRDFGITIAIATLFSLLVSFTLTPMLTSRWYRKEDVVPAGEEGSHEDEPTRPAPRGISSRFFAQFDRFYSALSGGYRSVLEWALDHRLVTVFIGIVSLVASIGLTVSGPPLRAIQVMIAVLTLTGLLAGGRAGRRAMAGVGVSLLLVISLFHAPLGKEFEPRMDQGQITVSIELPAGSSLEATDAVARQLEAFVLDRDRFPEVDSVYGTVGSGMGGIFGGGATGAPYGGLRVVLVDKLQRERSDIQVMAEINDFARTIPGAVIKASVYAGMGGGGEQPINIEVSGSDMAEILRVADDIKRRVAEAPGTLHTDISWRMGKPEVRAEIDRHRAADRGVSTFQVARALRTSLEGDTSTKYREGSDQYDIRVRLRELDRSSVADLSDLMVAHNAGPVYLADVANVVRATGPTKIDRKNRQRLVAVQAGLAEGYPLGNVVDDIRSTIADIDLGDVSIHFGGEAEIMQESFGHTGLALALSVILVYILMAALFEGYLSPLIIMFALPMALAGALLAIVLTGQTLNIITIIGIIMLVGLVNKNAILLVDYTNTLRARGLSRRDALLQAGPTRLRPILMTTISLIFAMLPVAVMPSRGGEFRSPMAIAVIGGLTLSMFLTLLVIPVLYTVFDNIAIWFSQRLKHTLNRFLP